MLNSDKRYRAYQLLKELDKSTSSLMSRIAYSRAENLSWEEELQAQRKAFEEWMSFAISITEDM